ncbi:hypothetical protein GGR50DRAFT_696405 [Xylaria sp. CBS 124048]|nr:hypothetical protein GGR50DRAFT_696405 [Xylaria sp. CBS 124048]
MLTSYALLPRTATISVWTAHPSLGDIMDRILRQAAPRAYATARAIGSRRSILLLSQQHLRRQSSAPTIIQPSFWKALIPKAFRPKHRSTTDFGATAKMKKKSQEWNPATFYIVIFMLIGSMAINMIALKKDFATFMRRAEVRIELLREVVEKIQRGEDVDVEKTLGTGDQEKELQWEEVLRDIERDDVFKNTKKAGKGKTPSPTPEVLKSEPESTSTQKQKQTESAPAKTSFSNFF